LCTIETKEFLLWTRSVYWESERERRGPRRRGRNLGVLGEFTKGRTCREQLDVYYGKAQVFFVGFLQCKIKQSLVDAVLEYVERLWRKNKS